ncbi:MAG: phosphatidate cytidylyltransferase [Gemmatimonadetes bacterium]|nr:phosphatidate cytidylyltransferase [Gemmatimonadota bacterium]
MSTPSPKKRSAGSLAARVLSAVVFLPLFVWIVRAGGLPFSFLVGAIVVLATAETYNLLSAPARPYLAFGIVSAAVLAAILARDTGALLLPFFTIFFLLLFLSLLVTRAPSAARIGGEVVFALFYAAYLPAHMLLIRALPDARGTGMETGAALLFLVFLATWGTDTGAYFTGKWIGRTPLAPVISPRKTVEGSLGGLVWALLGGWLAHVWFLPELPLAHCLMLAFGASVLGQAGDLCESVLKRQAGVKDSATWIPGHGGVLDRFDAIFFATPFAYIYLRLVLS